MSNKDEQADPLNQQFRRKEINMIKSNYKSYDELPLMLSVKILADVLGVSISSAYELTREEGFPAVNVGKRIVIPKDKFKQWLEENTNGGM